MNNFLSENLSDLLSEKNLLSENKIIWMNNEIRNKRIRTLQKQNSIFYYTYKLCLDYTYFEFLINFIFSYVDERMK